MADNYSTEAPAVAASCRPENFKAWNEATVGHLRQAKDGTEKVSQSVVRLEHTVDDRFEAQRAERERQRQLALAAEARRKREAARRAAEELKRQQAADLKARHEEMEAMKSDARSALKAATAMFNQQCQVDAFIREKEYQMKSVNDALQKLGNCVSKCQHACRMKYSVMKVCEMRLAKRDERPNEEHFRDRADDALLKELAIVNKAREDLTAITKAGEQVKAEMEETIHLITTDRSRENVTRRLHKSASLPLLAAPVTAAPTMQELVRKTYTLVARALDISARGEETMLRTSAECQRASQASDACLDRRTSETRAFQVDLSSHKLEAHQMIHDAEKKVSLLQMKLKRVYETPDQVEATRDQVKSCETYISELRRGERCVLQDWQRKTHAWKIDKSCRQLTKVRAGTFVSKETDAGAAVTEQPAAAAAM